jgi:hypothetical protein
MRRFQSRKGNGRWQKNTLKNTFGLHCVFCPHCGIGNPWGINETKPEKCHSCKNSLEK